MNHSIETKVYVYIGEEEYEERELEITFDINKNSYEITGYFMDGKEANHERLLEANPNLEKHINYEIDHYVSNYEGDEYDSENEPDFFDCE